MQIKNFQKLTLTNHNLTAYMSNFNILQNKDIIFPHEETTSDNHITNEIIKSSVIVLGATFQSISDEITIDDKIFILDGHHRTKFIIANSIDEYFEVVFLDIDKVNIESHNSELNMDAGIFFNGIISKKGFSIDNLSPYFIEVNDVKYFAKDISSIEELYLFKKELLSDSIISPLQNNKKSNKPIVNFTPITSKDFSSNFVFPYKSTWITPRFDI